MGKRAAPKPKPEPKAKAAKRPKASSAATAAPPEAAPAHWGRPEAPDLDPDGSRLRFFLVDIEDHCGAQELGDELRLYGVTCGGASLGARLRGVRPYFYVRCPPECRGGGEAVERLHRALEASLPHELRSRGQQLVVGVEMVRRTAVLVYQPEEDMLRVQVAGAKCMAPCARALERGVRVPAADGQGAFEVQAQTTFEASVALVLRFLVDNDLGGGRWVELAAGRYSMSPGPKATTAQLEVDVAMDAAEPPLQAVPLDTDEGSSIPPVRVAAIEVLADAEERLRAASCVVSVQGRRGRLARAVWLCREPREPGSAAGDQGADWGSVTMECYEPGKDEPAQVFQSASPELLAEHLGRTLELFDADAIVSYNLPRMLRPLVDKKGAVPAGSAVARGVCRRLSSEIRITKNSGQVQGLAGRLGFDLERQVEKEHRLTDYSLGALSEHFCGEPLPELREALLARLASERPAALAQHVLRQAEASLGIFDHLAYLYNFVEMARVTGCPLDYLLERGQAVKVQTQLLREARARGFVLPSQRPGNGEENTFEGATVLDPSVGFYRAPIAVLDFASLYPSIMIAHNLCYSTLLPAGAEHRPGAPEHGLSPETAAAKESDTRSCFVLPSVRRGLLPSILERLLMARKQAKKSLGSITDASIESETKRKVLNGRQLALKLSANSVYGFTGAMNGPLPCLELAGAVTAYGREMIKSTKRKVESHFVQANGFRYDAEVVYGDTDSVMVRFGPEELSLQEAMDLSAKAAEVCSAEFPSPARLEFEKVYRPYLIMAKKRYAGLAFASPGSAPKLDTKGIETVRRDWSDLVRQGLDRTLHLLLRPDGEDGVASAKAYVRNLCDEVRQNKVDFRSLIISKSLGRDEYATKLPHVTVAEKLRKRDPASAPSIGDRVPYLVLGGAAKTNVNERAEDPLYALEHELPIDAEYYLEKQLKQPLIRVFELVLGSAQKAEQELFGAAPAEKKVVASAGISTLGGMGKFMKPRLKCLDCGAATTPDGQSFCDLCSKKGPVRAQRVREEAIERARGLRKDLEDLRAHCRQRCAVLPGSFLGLPPDPPAEERSAEQDGRERCDNLNCQGIFRRVRVAKELKAASDALARLKVTDW